MTGDNPCHEHDSSHQSRGSSPLPQCGIGTGGVQSIVGSGHHRAPGAPDDLRVRERLSQPERRLCRHRGRGAGGTILPPSGWPVRRGDRGGTAVDPRPLQPARSSLPPPPPPSCRPNRSAAGSSWWCGRRRAKFCVTPRKSDPYADSRRRSAWLPPCAAARLVAANSYASRAPILHRDLLPWLMLLLRNTAWDPDMVVVPSFETHAPLTPTLRIERLTDEPVYSPPCRG